MQIICPKCQYVLRQTAGLHRAGEPLGHFDARGHVIQCPRCGTEYRAQGDEQRESESKTARANRG